MKGGPFEVAVVQKGWRPLKLRHVVARRRDTGYPDLPLLTVSLDRGVTVRSDERYVAPSLDLSGYQRVRVGDIVMNQLGKPHGAIGASEYEGIISPAYFVMETLPRATPRFMHYLLRSWLYLEEFRRRSKWMPPSQLDISWDQFRDISVLVPPVETQHRIADFLDRETARIDALVDKKRRLIYLLEEKRTATITRAVTKGLDPTVPMVDSGVLGIGAIPEHWHVATVGVLFRLGRGRVISHEEIANNPGPYPVYSSQTANDGVMGYMATYDFEGDYITWTTDGAKAGTVFRRTGQFNCTNVCGTLEPLDTRLDLDYVARCLDIATTPFVRTSDVNPKLMNDTMGTIRLLVPPLAEQRAITDYISNKSLPIDRVNSALTLQVDLLAEYRQALITAAVTGELDVSSFDGERQLEEVGS